MLIFNNSSGLTIFISAVSIYLIIGALVSFDKKQIKMVKKGTLPSNFTLLPEWMEYLYWLELFLLVIILVIHWRLGLIVFSSRVVLHYLGLLQKVGCLIVQSFKKFKAG